MKKIFSGIIKLLRKRLFGIISLLVGIIIALIYMQIPEEDYGGITKAYFYCPTFLAKSADRLALIDSGDLLYCIDTSDDSIAFVINSGQLNYGECYFNEAVFDDKGNIYASVTVVNAEAYLTDMDIICEFDSDGEFIREVCRYDYTQGENPPHRTSRISALNIYDGRLRFVHTDENYGVELLSAELDSVGFNEECYVPMENYNGFCDIAPAENGEYAVIRTNGETGILTSEGEFYLMYSSEYSADDYEGGYYPYLISCVDGEIYVAEGLYGDSIFKVSDGYIEQYLSVSDLPGIEEYGMFSVLSAYDGSLAVAADNTVYIEGDSGTSIINGGYTLPLKQIAAVLAKKICPAIAGIFIVLGLISCIGCLMNWRFSLLSKLLWLIIPVVGLIITLLVASMIDSIGEGFDEQITQQMTAIAELSVKMLDGDKIEAMTTMDCVSDGSLYVLSEQLSDMTDRNSNDWSKTFDSKVCLTRDNLYISLAYSGGYTMPFGDFSYIEDEQASIGVDYGSDTIISYIYGTGVNEIVADTPIYNSKGECVAYFELSADISTIDDELYEMKMNAVKQALISAPVLIAALALVTFFSVRALRSARSAVGKIADGDFTARIENVPNDEIGEICVGVNNMAGQLQTLFEQKDNNEKFYYKFVPEKFRELLHKENFTELSLGDAESADLTVLFCDIRSFSLNSEMMTAKENFEFVNIIYGIAGPIIRSCGGFVDKYIGDAVMALFESADSAVAAGTELYKEIVLNPETAERLGVSSVNIGIGIHSGMARVGIVGEEERMSGTVISNTVNLSSRLESLTKQYSTAMIISKDTLDRLSDPDSLNTRYLGMIQVAGVNEVKALYEVLDCLDEKRKAERMADEKDFREAVRMFHLGDLKGSVELFRKAAAEGENDPVPNMYIEYITQKINDGDFEHNVFRFRKK